MKINTPDGPRTVPEWAFCHCVTTHRPRYLHPYPFALPSGDELWLCPASYHQATTLLNMYLSLDGPPSTEALGSFNYFPRNLIKLCWQQIMEQRNDTEAFEEWKNSLKKDDDDDAYVGLFEDIKRLTSDE